MTSLRLGQAVHGAVGEATAFGFIVDFHRLRGFLPNSEVAIDMQLLVRDEIEAWIAELDPVLGWIGLSMRLSPGSDLRRWSRFSFRPDLTPPGRPPVRMGEGVPFHELYMKRRSKRSWSR